jgi:hypothetical protein
MLRQLAAKAPKLEEESQDVMVMSGICPHNRSNPVDVSEPCYRCGSRWKIMHLTPDEEEAIKRWQGNCVVRCTGCRIVSMATRAAAAPSACAS